MALDNFRSEVMFRVILMFSLISVLGAVPFSFRKSGSSTPVESDIPPQPEFWWTFSEGGAGGSGGLNNNPGNFTNSGSLVGVFINNDVATTTNGLIGNSLYFFGSPDNSGEQGIIELVSTNLAHTQGNSHSWCFWANNNSGVTNNWATLFEVGIWRRAGPYPYDLLDFHDSEHSIQLSEPYIFFTSGDGGAFNIYEFTSAGGTPFGANGLKNYAVYLKWDSFFGWEGTLAWTNMDSGVDFFVVHDSPNFITLGPAAGRMSGTGMGGVTGATTFTTITPEPGYDIDTVTSIITNKSAKIRPWNNAAIEPFPSATFGSIQNYAPTNDLIFIDPAPVDPNNTWVFYAYVHDATTGIWSIYRNTNLLGTTTIPITVPTSKPGTTPDRLFFQNGMEILMDEFAFWKTHALTPANIVWLYNNNNGRTYSDIPPP